MIRFWDDKWIDVDCRLIDKCAGLLTVEERNVRVGKWLMGRVIEIWRRWEVGQ